MTVLDKITTVIFDLDGVILSERPYWKTAAATAQDMLDDLRLANEGFPDEDAEGVIPLSLIDTLKTRGVNSNWDLAYVVLSAAMQLGFECQPQDTQRMIASATAALIENPAVEWPRWAKLWLPATWKPAEFALVIKRFWQRLGLQTGHSVMQEWAAFLSQECPTLAALWQSPALFNLSQAQFQNRLTREPLQHIPAVDLPSLRQGLDHLTQKKVTLGVATGRPLAEAVAALRALDLMDCFENVRVITYDHVLAAEQAEKISPLGKPHPYCLLQAAHPDMPFSDLCRPDFAGQLRPWLIYVGDSGSDSLTAQAASAEAHMVLTGCATRSHTEIRRRQFTESGVKHIHPTVLDFLTYLEGKMA